MDEITRRINYINKEVEEIEITIHENSKQYEINLYTKRDGAHEIGMQTPRCQER